MKKIVLLIMLLLVLVGCAERTNKLYFLEISNDDRLVLHSKTHSNKDRMFFWHVCNVDTIEKLNYLFYCSECLDDDEIMLIDTLLMRKTSQKVWSNPRYELYTTLKADKVFNGDYSEFTAKLDRKDKRHEWYGILSQNGYPVGTEEEFNHLMNKYEISDEKGQKRVVFADEYDDFMHRHADNKNIPRRNLYDNLVEDGYDLGTYSDFTAAIDKEGTRKILYDNLVDEGYDIGDYDSFNEQLNIGMIQ